MKMLMCNMSWMREYKGNTEYDIARHGGGYVAEKGFGHEALNFRNNGGRVYGFVTATRGTINIARIDPNAVSKAKGVLLVWRARSQHGSVVVGWYKNATVYRTIQKPNLVRKFIHERVVQRPGWFITAKASDAVLVPASRRNFRVPVTEKGFGAQNFVSFLDSGLPSVVQFKKHLIAYISRVEQGDYSLTNKGKFRGKSDPLHNAKVERVAIKSAIKYYTSSGYNVESVEMENRGYDLVATKGRNQLWVEVKGTALEKQSEVTVGLTPNEYRKSNKAYGRYRIFIVTSALTKKPAASEFAWDEDQSAWYDEANGFYLEVKEITSANLSIVLE